MLDKFIAYELIYAEKHLSRWFVPLDVSRWANFIHNTLDTKCVGFSFSDQPILRTPTGWVSYNSIQFCHHQKLSPDFTLSRARSNTGLTPDASCTSQVATCTSNHGYEFEDSHNSLLRFNTLLEQLAELRKTLYYYQLIMKDTTQKQPKGRDSHNKGLGERHGTSMHSPSIRPFQCPDVFTNPEALQTPSIRGFYGGITVD